MSMYIYMYTCIYIYTYMKLSAAILCMPRNFKQCIGAIFERPGILRASYVNMHYICVHCPQQFYACKNPRECVNAIFDRPRICGRHR